MKGTSRPSKTAMIEVEERFVIGWVRHTLSAPSEHHAFARARKLVRRNDMREVRVVVVEAGRVSRYTLKARFPRPPKKPPAEWLNTIAHATVVPSGVGAP